MRQMFPEKIFKLIWIVLIPVILGLPLILFNIEKAALVSELSFFYFIPQFKNVYLYLNHHLLAVMPVFFFGFVLNWFGYRDIFKREFFWPMMGVSLFYIMWDIAFTYLGIWGFEESLHLGIEVVGLPLEELMWFMCIPFCSLFIFIIIEKRIKFGVKADGMMKLIFLLLFILAYAMNTSHVYSVISFGTCVLLLLFGWQLAEPGFGVFGLSFLIILLPMFVFNGMLTGLFTGTALVQYNPLEFSGIRLGSFPIEDIGFGFGYLYGIVKWRNYLKQRRARDYAV